jgi:hypothetical protein
VLKMKVVHHSYSAVQPTAKKFNSAVSTTLFAVSVTLTPDLPV